jgi:signal transduction histidine kinase
VAQSLFAQQAGHWRIFKKADGLAENVCLSVTLGTSGNVLVRHPRSASVSVLDGYSITNVPGPDNNRYRVYESSAGQFWTLSPGGLYEYRDGEWVLHRLPEVSGQLQSATNSLVLWPVRQGRVLILLPDRLIQFTTDESEGPHSEPLLREEQTKIGKFKMLSPARDGGLWIAGQRGLAKVAGPLPGLKADSPWKEFLPPSDLHLQNFSSLNEGEGGVVTAIAEVRPYEVSLATFDGQRWTERPLPVKGLRAAWRTGETLWGATEESLLQFSDDKAQSPKIEEIQANRIFDVAIEPGGAFWLATSMGVYRYAPPLWHSPTEKVLSASRNQPGSNPGETLNLSKVPGLSDGAIDPAVINANWQTYLTAKNGDIWLGGQDTAWRHRNAWRVFSSKDQLGPEDVLAFAESPDGKISCATASKVWKFDGKNWLTLRAGFDHINSLLASRDGTLWVASQNGAHRFTHGAWLGYGTEDGMPSPVVHNIFEDEAGRIVANTANGLTLFQANADTDAPKSFIHHAGKSEIHFRENAPITLPFSGRDKWNLTEPNRLMFSDRLDEHEWSPFQDLHEVSFADLSLGKHHFQVRAMDRNGNIDQNPARMEFAVVVPWYRETRLVLILSIALVIALFFAALAMNRQRQLRRAYALVEKKIAERTRELEIANRELLHSQKMNALGTLAAGIAHDFNNILSIVKGSAQIIEDNVDNPQKIRTRTDRIKTVVEQGSGIVKAMLGFSSGSEDPAAPCNVNAVVENTIKLLGDRFLREVQVTFTPTEGLPEVAAQRDFIQQILLNFIFNASEAVTARKQIELTTQVLKQLPTNLVLTPKSAPGYVAISVRDFGSGIAPENMPRIFEPFFTTKALSTKRGTGLGLSMVYELAKKLEAGVSVVSAVNEGSTFTLILPAPGIAKTNHHDAEKPVGALTAP